MLHTGYPLSCLPIYAHNAHTFGVPPLLLVSMNVASGYWKHPERPNWYLLEEHFVDMKRGRSPSDCTYNKLQWNFMRNYGISLRSRPVAHTSLLLILMQPHLHTLPGLRTFATCKEARGQFALTWQGITFRYLINMDNSLTMFRPSILPGTRLQSILRLCWYLLILGNTILRFKPFARMRTYLTLPLATGWVTMATWYWKNGDVGAPSLRLNG